MTERAHMHALLRDAGLLFAGAAMASFWLLRAQRLRCKAVGTRGEANTSTTITRNGLSKHAEAVAGFAIREATPADLPLLRSFEQGVVSAERPFSPMIRDDDVPVIYYDLEGLLKDEHSRLVLVEETAGEKQGVAAGYLTIRQSKTSCVHSHHGYLGFMYVMPRLRGRGVNRLVMDHLVTWGQSKGIEHFYLDVYSDNSFALRAYEKVGFSTLRCEMHARFPASGVRPT